MKLTVGRRSQFVAIYEHILFLVESFLIINQHISIENLILNCSYTRKNKGYNNYKTDLCDIRSLRGIERGEKSQMLKTDTVYSVKCTTTASRTAVGSKYQQTSEYEK